MWTSGGAILRDLSRAQGGAGRGAHAELRALRPRDRPPPPPRWLSEEMEEYVRGLAPAPPVPAAACEAGPDLRHIQQMLDMVRKLNIAEEEMANDEALIGKLDSYAIEHSRSTELYRAELVGPAHTAPAAAQALGPGQELPEPKKHKKRRRNIALESILQALENNERNDAIHCTSEQFTLLTPEDLTTKFPENINNSTIGATDQTNAEDTENTSSYIKIDSRDKVNHWMNLMMSPIQTKCQSKRVVREAIRLDPSSMFKKKVKADIAKPRSKVNCEAAFNKDKSPANGSASYVPSAGASLCYQRYLENNKQLQIRREEASQLAVLITEALERAARAEATERAVQVEATELALEEVTDQAVLGEAPELAVLEEASERAVLKEAPERAALEATERAALGEALERTAVEESTERVALEEATERAAQATTLCVVSGVRRALLLAPASARLAEPRACAPRAPCLVCARLTRRAAPAPAAPAPAAALLADSGEACSPPEPCYVSTSSGCSGAAALFCSDGSVPLGI